MASDDFEMPVYLDWEPRAVVCRRGPFASPSYDAEVKFLDKQYAISQGHSTHESAKAAAQVEVDKLVARIKLAQQEILTSRFKEAKP